MLALTIIAPLPPPRCALRPIFGLGASTGHRTRFFGRGEQHTPMPGAVRARRVLLECEHHDVDVRRALQCAQNITFLQSGCDEGLVPLYYIAQDDQSLVDAHEGRMQRICALSILNDAQFGLKITVHDGFQQTFERTADSLLAGVMDGLKSTMKKIVVTGHSLGAALATMTAVMIKDAVDPSVDVSMTGFGLPRGGNQGWADFLDSQVLHSSRPHFVSNQNDPVPTVPPKFLGFQHSSGEIHIVDDSQTNLVACPGQDNANCATGNVLAVSVQNHLGPYFNDITFGGSQCSS
ncbi:alpha/beta-hydrolase [Mycena leptocephala]|nr:alpha/beta-hydrolase [Mycena leptocephala]